MSRRPRSVIEDDIKTAEHALMLAMLAEDDLEQAKYDYNNADERLTELEDELAAEPDGGVDEEIWFAHHDPRQLNLLTGVVSSSPKS